jgi:hypothetical protein
MDPVPSAALQAAVKSRQAKGGTSQYLYYNTEAWGGAGYYGGSNAKGLYGPIKNLTGLLSNAVKTRTGHYDIPSSMISDIKIQIEKALG